MGTDMSSEPSLQIIGKTNTKESQKLEEIGFFHNAWSKTGFLHEGADFCLSVYREGSAIWHTDWYRRVDAHVHQLYIPEVPEAEATFKFPASTHRALHKVLYRDQHYFLSVLSIEMIWTDSLKSGRLEDSPSVKTNQPHPTFAVLQVGMKLGTGRQAVILNIGNKGEFFQSGRNPLLLSPWCHRGMKSIDLNTSCFEAIKTAVNNNIKSWKTGNKR